MADPRPPWSCDRAWDEFSAGVLGDKADEAELLLMKAVFYTGFSRGFNVTALVTEQFASVFDIKGGTAALQYVERELAGAALTLAQALQARMKERRP